MSFVVKSVTTNQYKVKVVNQNGALLTMPASVPVVTASAISDLTKFSNTTAMLANDATTYANAIAYAANLGYNAAETAYANAIAYSSNLISNNLSNFSNTTFMLANDATTYANAIAYAANLISNSVANIAVASISDVQLSQVPPANNSTLVFNTTNNKYVVRQMDLDGGNF
jgi:hypothetical protein